MLQMYSIVDHDGTGVGGTSSDADGEVRSRGRDLLEGGMVEAGEPTPVVGIELLAVMMLVMVTVAALARVVRHRDVVYGITAVCTMAAIVGGFKEVDFTMSRTIASLCFGVLQVGSTWMLLQLFSDTQNGG